MNCHFCETEVGNGKNQCAKCGARYGYLVKGEIRGPVWMAFRTMVWLALLAATLLLVVTLDGLAVRALAVLLLGIGLWMLGQLVVQWVKRPRWWRRTI